MKRVCKQSKQRTNEFWQKIAFNFIVLFYFCTLMSACYEAPNLDILEGCHPSEPQCASADFDGDGVPNGRDDFPLDDRCAEEGKLHCGGCERSCGLKFTCVDHLCVPIVDEFCDGLDNDLDQVIDEALNAPVANLNQGLCSGLTKVCAGALGWMEPTHESIDGYEENETLCDGLDNDCDGRVDELLTAPLSTPQLGVCSGLRLKCEGRQSWITPDRRLTLEHYEVSEASCDGLDNDCDGQVDERLGGIACQTGLLGRCAAGQEQCLMGELSCVAIAEAQTESCNFVDDDCDGQVDEDLTPPANYEAFGVCQQPLGRCEQGSWDIRPIEALSTYEVVEMTCDGLDNDCDGFTDESLAQPSCELSQNFGPCAEGRLECLEGSRVCQAVIQAQDELCDGVDNDCDGAVDEDLVLPLYPEQRGVCLGLTSICGGERGLQEVDPQRRLEYEADESSCDGLDNDCDGVIDENILSEPCQTSFIGECAHGVSRCIEGELHCVANLAQDESCDGLDNDCDGAIDEALLIPRTALTLGVCEGRFQICRDEEGWVEPSLPSLFEDEELSCDGFDNDCDGQVDEQLIGPLDPSSDLSGVCIEQRLVCRDGILVSPNETERLSQGIFYEVEELSCDGLDNDCDGQVDETPLDGWGRCETNLVGACQQGNLSCVNGELSCLAIQEPSAELCDGLDNDCDGDIDESLVAGSCSVGQGACLQSGVARCVNAQFVCDAQAPLPQDERCNDFDDDCDGQVDESFALSGLECTVGVGSCRRQGAWQCTLGELSCSAIAGPAHDELCDGIDNDCDAQVDEDFVQLARPCVAGLGECTVRGFWRCSELGDLQCGEGEREAVSEICDGLDNDCDGQSDEHVSDEYCDQIDNDCDGLVDENVATESCNQQDDDCDGLIDESPCGLCLDSNSCPNLTWYTLPDGDFLMGGTQENNQPIHAVRMIQFQMSDEITVTQYQDCVQAGFCSPAGTGGDCNMGQIDREQHPINCVSWLQAHQYAYWVGARLPTEAEWEYAARSAGLNQVTPWGGTAVTCEFALLRDPSGYACGLYQTVAIKDPRHQAGQSSQGLWDLLGNVSEWVEDDYVADYEQASPQGDAFCDQDLCDAQGDKVHRGGGWRTLIDELNNRSRFSAFYQLKSAEIGFRVVRQGP